MTNCHGLKMFAKDGKMMTKKRGKSVVPKLGTTKNEIISKWKNEKNTEQLLNFKE